MARFNEKSATLLYQLIERYYPELVTAREAAHRVRSVELGTALEAGSGSSSARAAVGASK